MRPPPSGRLAAEADVSERLPVWPSRSRPPNGERRRLGRAREAREAEPTPVPPRPRSRRRPEPRRDDPHAEPSRRRAPRRMPAPRALPERPPAGRPRRAAGRAPGAPRRLAPRGQREAERAGPRAAAPHQPHGRPDGLVPVQPWPPPLARRPAQSPAASERDAIRSQDTEIRLDGIDISTAPAAPAVSVFEGVVQRVGRIPTYGQYVMVTHGEFVTLYGNLSQVSVRQGQSCPRRAG